MPWRRKLVLIEVNVLVKDTGHQSESMAFLPFFSFLCFFSFVLSFFETGFCYIFQAGLELTLWPRLVSNSP